MGRPRKYPIGSKAAPKKNKGAVNFGKDVFLASGGTFAEIISDKSTDEIIDDVEIIELERKKKTYWSDETEAAVVEFLMHDCNYFSVQLEKYFDECAKKDVEVDMNRVNELQEKIEWASAENIIEFKDKIYKSQIHKPLSRLVENIMFTYRQFVPGVDIKTAQGDCLSHVYSKFSNFNPNKNTKSFSFFGTIAKHYLMGEKKDTDKSRQTNLDYDNHRDEADEKKIINPGDRIDVDKSHKLFVHVIDALEKEVQKKIDNPFDKKNISDNDAKVADAIIDIFKNHEIVGAYNKNHLYHLIKEHTGLQPKDITYSLTRFRVFYRLLKKDYTKNNLDED